MEFEDQPVIKRIMENWFPFTDQYFYSYLTADMIVLFSLD